MKFKPVYQYRLRHDASLLGYAYLGIFAGIWWLPTLLSLLLTGRQSALAPSQYLASLFPQFAMQILFFIASGMVYRGFTVLIQNGITRRTYWWAKLASLLTYAGLVSVLNVLYRLMIAQPLGLKTYQVYGRLEFGSFTTHGISDVWWYWGRDLSTLILLIGAGMMTGAVLALLNWRWKVATLIAVPCAGAGLIAITLASVGNTSNAFYNSWAGALLRLMYGFDGHFRYQAPGNSIVTNVILTIICLLISYAFNRLLAVRRG